MDNIVSVVHRYYNIVHDPAHDQRSLVQAYLVLLSQLLTCPGQRCGDTTRRERKQGPESTHAVCAKSQ